MPNEMLVAPSGRPAASLSLDLDNLWSYLMTAGDERWRAYPTYLPRFVPNVLELLDTLQLNITFFVVGADARRDENGAALQSIVAAGHEVGNHSDRHEPWLLRQSRAALEEDIEQAEDAITLCAGARPRGYRGPGFSCNVDVLEVLAQRGYRYDASTWPTFVGPIARRFYFASTKLSDAEREDRGALFGTWRAGFSPNEAYQWHLPSGRRLLEIPVTVVPFVRTPLHFTYLLYLARSSESLALAYWRSALAACRIAGVQPSVLLHPTDLIGADLVPELRFFPGMSVAGDVKRRLLIKALGILRERYDVLPMSLHAERLASRSQLRVRPAARAVRAPLVDRPSTSTLS